LFGPTGDGTATKTNRTAHAGGGKRSPQVLPELFGAPTGKKTRGRGRSGSAADFLLGPQALMELVGPPGGKIKGSTGRSGALPICCGAPKHQLD